MEFTINAKSLLEAIMPAVEVATKEADKEYEHSFRVMLKAKTDYLELVAYNSKVAIDIHASDSTMEDTGYHHIEDGSVTVCATDLLKTVSSFQKDEKINVVSNDNEVRFIPDSDSDQYQTLMLFKKAIPIAPKEDNIEKSFKIDRMVLKNGFNKIKFALGYEESRPQYLNWVIKCSEDKIRFVSGSGRQFAILDVYGKSIVEISNKDSNVDLVIPKSHSLVGMSVLKYAKDEYITISKSNKPEQITFICNLFRLSFLRFDANIDFPDENKILKRDNDFIIQTSSKAWEMPVRGVNATFGSDLQEQGIYQRAEISIDTQNDVIVLKTEGSMKSKRKVKIKNIIKTNNEDRKWICPVSYLSEIVSNSKNSDDEDINICLSGALHPVLILFPEQINTSTGIKENFSFFLTCVKELVNG